MPHCRAPIRHLSGGMGGASTPATQVRLQPHCCPCETVRGAVASSFGKLWHGIRKGEGLLSGIEARVCVVLLNGGQIFQVWNQYLRVFASFGTARLGTVGCFHVQIGRVL